MEQVSFTVDVSFLSDWAFGTGHGRHGSVDHAVERDAAGMPFVRGKAMASLLREEATILAAGLDGESKERHWLAWVEFIFGTHLSQGAVGAPHAPRPAALSPKRLTLVGRDEILQIGESSTGVGRAQLVEALFTTRMSVSLDPVNKVAKEDFLRLEEYARAGLMVSGAWSVELPKGGQRDGSLSSTDPGWPAKLLLLAAAHSLRRVGRKRRRGLGKCVVTLAFPGGETLEQLIGIATAQKGDPGEPPARDSSDRSLMQSDLLARSEIEGASERNALRRVADLVLTVRSPVIVDSGLRGNVVLSESFIPGTLLLPIVARAIGGTSSQLIAGDQLIVTDATLEINGVRALPWPQNLQRSKDALGDETPFTVVTHEHELDPRAKAPQDSYLVDVGSPSGQHSESTVFRGDISFAKLSHNQVDTQAQRPVSGSGGPFVYTGISVGTVLRAEVWSSQSIISKALSAVAGTQAIGVSKKDDYGDVDVQVEFAREGEVGGGPRIAINPGDEVAVWLTSDVLLVDDAGAFDPTPERLVMELRAAGLPVRLPEVSGVSRRVVAISSSRRRESWQRRWGLPRPSLIGMRAGSVVVVVAESAIRPEQIAGVEGSGLGLRRVEGFGRVVMSSPILAGQSARVSQPAGTFFGVVAENDFSRLDQNLLRRAWSVQLRSRAVAFALDPQKRRRILPDVASNSQLGNLRSVVEQLRIHGGKVDGVVFDAWYASTNKIKSRRSMWSDVLKTVHELIHGQSSSAQPHTVWDESFLGLTTRELRSLPEGAPRSELELEAVKHLLLEGIRVQASSRRQDV